MPGLARANVDYATTHSNGDVHVLPLYVGGLGSNVFVNNNLAIVKGDLTTCGDKTVGASSTVFIGGKGVHRLGDILDSHAGTYSPSFCGSAALTVFAN